MKMFPWSLMNNFFGMRHFSSGITTLCVSVQKQHKTSKWDKIWQTMMRCFETVLPARERKFGSRTSFSGLGRTTSPGTTLRTSSSNPSRQKFLNARSWPSCFSTSYSTEKSPPRWEGTSSRSKSSTRSWGRRCVWKASTFSKYSLLPSIQRCSRSASSRTSHRRKSSSRMAMTWWATCSLRSCLRSSPRFGRTRSSFLTARQDSFVTRTLSRRRVKNAVSSNLLTEVCRSQKLILQTSSTDFLRNNFQRF